MSEKQLSPVQNLKQLVDDQITTFIESNGIPYVHLNDKPFASFPITSQKFSGHLYKQYFNYQKAAQENDKQVKDLTTKHIKDYCDYITGMAYASDLSITAWNRVGYDTDTNTYYYNLGDGINSVEINQDSLQLVKQAPITFNYFDKFNSIQCTPDFDADISNINKIFDYINIEDNNSKILLVTYIISLLNPNINKYILYFHGLKGSSKTTSFRIIRSLIDPSPISSHVSKDANLVSFPNTSDLMMLSKYHYCLYFDNVNFMHPQAQSVLARMALGQRDSKRALYENDDQVVYDYKPAIGINGVNQVMTQDELIQRSLLIEISKIKKRKTEDDIWENFHKDKPLILGAMMKVFQKAISIARNEDIDTNLLPRMADNAKWMMAVAIAMGMDKKNMYSILNENTKEQDIESIEFSPSAQMIIEFMQTRTEWKGTTTELHNEIKTILDSGYTVNKKTSRFKIGNKSEDFPSDVRKFGAEIKKLNENLKNMGYDINKLPRSSKGNVYQITNLSKAKIQESYLDEAEI